MSALVFPILSPPPCAGSCPPLCLLWWPKAVDMVGVKRPISQGVRFDMINTLERYHLGEFAMSRYIMRTIFLLLLLLLLLVFFNFFPCSVEYQFLCPLDRTASLSLM